MAKAEKLLIENRSLKDIFKDDFIKKLEEVDLNIFPVSVVFINEIESEGKKFAYPIIINHQNNIEVKNKIMHIESANTDLLTKIVNIVEHLDKK